MSFMKSFLLGSAAGFVAVAGASAADLPSRKAAPVEYVRVCSEQGEGFFYIPGSDTCIKIGGRVRADLDIVQTYDRNQDVVNFTAQGRLELDVRNNTPHGTVRAFFRYIIARDGSNKDYNGGLNSSGSYNDASLDRAYIQVAGLTAGRTQSFFDFYANEHNWATIRGSDTTTNLLSYTAILGNGFSATLGLEDGTQRRVVNEDSLTATDASGNLYRIDGTSPAGQSMPDVVGNIRVDQDYGAAQLSASLHQLRPAHFDRSGSSFGPDYFNRDTAYGFAVQAGVQFNLNMLAPGDQLWIQAAYAEGAAAYLGAGDTLQRRDIAVPVADGFVDANGRLQKTKGWAVVADFLHYWTPSVRQNVFASYMKLDPGRNGYFTTDLSAFGLGTVNQGFVDVSEFKVGSNVIWSPIKNFDIGVEVLYTRLDPKGRVLQDNSGVLKSG